VGLAGAGEAEGAVNPNTVELLAVHGNDLDIACAAWASTGAELTEERRARVPAFLAQLAKDRHTVPFEHAFVRFRVNVDMATHVHLLKHRIGVSVSSQSMRWAERREDRYYVPGDWPRGAGDALMEHAERSFGLYHAHVREMEAHYLAAGMGPKQARDRAKETARYFLPMAVHVRSVVSMSFLAFANFLRLRLSTHAQPEIRDVAGAMLEHVWDSGQLCAALTAWGYGGKLEAV
jgi:flavin-dependent thymidylate synthase